MPAPLKGNFAMFRFCLVAGLAGAMALLHMPDVLAETDDQAQARLDDALSRLDGLIAGDTPGTDTGAPDTPDTGANDPSLTPMWGACIHNRSSRRASYTARWEGEASFDITLEPTYSWCHWRANANQRLTLSYSGYEYSVPTAKVGCESMNECSRLGAFPAFILGDNPTAGSPG
ncbi:MAG: hypothetical protein KDJ55_04535 [Rhodobiaceae bacterium]|nr:hypothetical protein [Rhodobiaceae bacterium]MCC0052263.1 hypothetical protein [Rhodobiaceae bacterium]